jgi:hypothetical protein
MDRRERFAEAEEALRLAMTANRAGLWTCLPGIIQSFNTADPDNVTAVIQPAIKGVVQQQDGTYQAVNLPVLPDVPVVFPRGGGCTLTFPIAAGDECLVIFSSRCIDGWWQSGGVQLPMEPRLHDLSDGFAILGPQSKPNKISNISTTAVQLRSNDGQAYIQLNPTTYEIDIVTPGNASVTAGGNLNASVTGNVTMTAAQFTLNGPVQINGTVTATGEVTGNGITLSTHKHTGVQTGGGVTGGPTG